MRFAQAHPLKPVKVALEGIPSLQRVNRTTQLGVIGRVAFERKPLTLQHVGAKQHVNSLSHMKNVSEHFQTSLRFQFQKWRGI